MAILKATVGKLLDKGRKMVADRLEEGDVTDEQFRTMIVGEIDEIKVEARRNSNSCSN